MGASHETSAFAVESIRRWWRGLGKKAHPSASRVLICADAGGSNGHRRRGWKYHLQQLADETGLSITVCHYPPGTSKWNKVEHRLFSHISLHWRGEPLESYESVIQLIRTTKTRTGLKVKAEMDWDEYPLKQTITDEQMDRLNLTRHNYHPDWNYTLSPRGDP